MHQTTVCATTWIPTPDMRERHRLWMTETGSPAPEATDWMHPLDALAVVVTLDDGPVDEESRNAWRTMTGLGAKGRLKWTAYALGISTLGARPYFPDLPHHDLRGPSCLYRFRDATGTLLYVGIAKDPDKREGEHARTSEWHAHAASREDQWHPHRDAALAAERDAIRTERPMFNRTRGVDARAARYLSERP